MITAIIPAYNSEKTIGEVVRRTRKYVNRVIVVDDGSSDMTTKVAKVAGARILRHAKNQGKAAAIRTGLSQTRGYIVLLDSDLQHRPEEIPRFVEKLKEGAELVIGSRFLDDHSSMPFHRKMTNYLSRLAILLRTGRVVTDIQSGFRALGGRGIELDLTDAYRYDLETIMLLKALEGGLKVAEVPITTVYGSASHFNYLSDTCRVIWALLFK